MDSNNRNAANNGDMEGAQDENREETLAERSARLEAEALGLYGKNAGSDPLAPEPLHGAAETGDTSALHQKIEALQNELDATKDRMMRAVADAENTKRRALKERDDASKFAVSKFSQDVLPVADNLRRALDAMPPEARADAQIANLIDGIEATERELLRVFEKNGIQKLDPLHQTFDPNFHEVMFETPMPSKPAGTVIQVMETGYVLNGRLIRPARVGVVKDDGQGGGISPSSEPGHTIDTQA